MNIRQNPNIGQQRPSQAPKPANAKALSEQLKIEGEQEVARGEQLQKDGVDLQTKGGQLKEDGAKTVEVGQGSKTQGQARVEQGTTQKAEGEQKIVAGLQTEVVARSQEAEHAEEFQVGLDAAAASRASADENIASLQTSLNAEKEATAAQGGQIKEYGSKTAQAGLVRGASALQQGAAASELQKEKDAQAIANEATGAFKEGIDAQAAGRKEMGDGRNDVRVSDDLKAQSENALNRSKGYYDRSVAHFDEASKLNEEVSVHNEAAESFQTQAGVADELGQVAADQSENQKAVAALLAAKAAIDLKAGAALSGLSDFAAEGERTRGEGFLAAGQAVRYSQRGEFYGSAAEGLRDESAQLGGQAGLETEQATRKGDNATSRQILGAGDLARSGKFFVDSESLAAKSDEKRQSGEALIASGTEKHAAGTTVVETALGQLSQANAAQEASHAAQTEIHTSLTGLNDQANQLIADREGVLAQMKDTGAAQSAALTEQSKTLGSFLVNHALGGASQAQRQSAIDGLVQEGSIINGAIVAQGEGFAQRTEGAGNVQVGAGMIRDGETLIQAGTANINEGERLTEEGRQKQEAGGVIVDKGQQYQQIAEQAAQVPFHITK